MRGSLAGWRRGRLGVVGLAVLAVAGGMASGGMSGGGMSGGGMAGGAGGHGSAASGATPASSIAAAPVAQREPGRSTERAVVGSRRAAAVGFGRDSRLPNGVAVRVGGQKRVTVTAHGPGEVGGAGVQFTVTVRNTTSQAISLDGVAVSTTVGSLPASPVDSPSGAPLSGSLAAGASATGTYVAVLPRSGRGKVHVEVQFNTSDTLLSFDGE